MPPASSRSRSHPSANQVASLEREIGARLLERERGGLRRSAREGAILLEHADAIAERFELARHPAGHRRGHRPLAAADSGAFPTALAELVPDAIEEIRGAHAPPRGSRSARARTICPSGVRSGALHLAVGFQDAAEPREVFDDLERRELLQERFMVAMVASPRPVADAPASRPPRARGRRLDRGDDRGI